MILITLFYINQTCTHVFKNVDQVAIRPINQVFYEDDDDDDDYDDAQDSNADQLVAVTDIKEESLTTTAESVFQSFFDLYEKTLRIAVIIMLISFFLYIIYICFLLEKNDKVYKSVE